MKEQLTQIFGLEPAAGQTEVSDAQVIEHARQLQGQANAAAAVQAEEREISRIVTESVGALSRDSAKQVLAQRRAGQTARA